MLGALPELAIECHEMTIDAKDTLVLCTDGWLEVGNPAEHEDPDSFAAMADSLAELGLDELTEACGRMHCVGVEASCETTS